GREPRADRHSRAQREHRHVRLAPIAALGHQRAEPTAWLRCSLPAGQLLGPLSLAHPWRDLPLHCPVALDLGVAGTTVEPPAGRGSLSADGRGLSEREDPRWRGWHHRPRQFPDGEALWLCKRRINRATGRDLATRAPADATPRFPRSLLCRADR